MALWDDFYWDGSTGEISVGGVTIDTGLGNTPEDVVESEVVYLEPEQAFPWEWVLGGGAVLLALYFWRK